MPAAPRPAARVRPCLPNEFMHHDSMMIAIGECECNLFHQQQVRHYVYTLACSSKYTSEFKYSVPRQAPRPWGCTSTWQRASAVAPSRLPTAQLRVYIYTCNWFPQLVPFKESCLVHLAPLKKSLHSDFYRLLKDSADRQSVL